MEQKERTKKVLIVSLSNLDRDPRVYRQIEALKGEYIVHAAGKQPSGIEDEFFYLYKELTQRNRFLTFLYAAKAGFLLHKLASAVIDRLNNRIRIPFAIQEAVLKTSPNTRRFMRAARNNSYDLVIANDITSIVQAYSAKGGAKFLYDAHEYSLDQYEDTRWRKRRRPYLEHVLRKYLPKADKTITVSKGIAERYSREFAIPVPEIVTNAPPYRELAPREMQPGKIRLVHHGVAAKLRMIEEMIRMIDLLDDRFELDFYLVTADKKYYETLVNANSGKSRIRFRDPVPMQRIPEMLNGYDMGLAFFAPRTTNLRYVLPNKFFEYVQGRVAIGIGPSVEMAGFVERYRLGVIAEDFTAEAMARALSPLTAEKIMEFKKNAHRHAVELSARPQMAKLCGIVESMIGK